MKGGRIVEVIETGKRGQTKNSDNPVNGKILVYLDDGGKKLIHPGKLKLIGFWD